MNKSDTAFDAHAIRSALQKARMYRLGVAVVLGGYLLGAAALFAFAWGVPQLALS